MRARCVEDVASVGREGGWVTCVCFGVGRVGRGSVVDRMTCGGLWI